MGVAVGLFLALLLTLIDTFGVRDLVADSDAVDADGHIFTDVRHQRDPNRTRFHHGGRQLKLTRGKQRALSDQAR